MYLTENTPEAQELRDNVVRLLTGDDIAQVELAMQMIEGGGWHHDFEGRVIRDIQYILAYNYVGTKNQSKIYPYIDFDCISCEEGIMDKAMTFFLNVKCKKLCCVIYTGETAKQKRRYKEKLVKKKVKALRKKYPALHVYCCRDGSEWFEIFCVKK